MSDRPGADYTPIPSAIAPDRGQRMRVLKGLDPKAGQVGRVKRVKWDAGDLLVTLAFNDGTTGEYWLDELVRAMGIYA